jgi:hypothetical protein
LIVVMIRAVAGSGPDLSLGRIGNVVTAAKVRHGQQDRSFWNYYGEPASSVWESPLLGR